MADCDIRKRIREFIEIVDFLLHQDGKEIRIITPYIYIQRGKLEDILNQSPYGAYDDIGHKLRVWRDLHWIDAPSGRITGKMRQGKVLVPMVKLNYQIAAALEAAGGREYGKLCKR